KTFIKEIRERLPKDMNDAKQVAGDQTAMENLLRTMEKNSPGEVREIMLKGAATLVGKALLPEADRYYLKAMNCPHHHRIFAAEPKSYRDLPLRLAEYGTCYRYEQSGELFGLMRVRSLNMNDAH